MDSEKFLTEGFEKIYRIFIEMTSGKDELMNMAFGSSVICALIDEFAIQKNLDAVEFAKFIAESVKTQHEMKPELYE